MIAPKEEALYPTNKVYILNLYKLYKDIHNLTSSLLFDTLAKNHSYL